MQFSEKKPYLHRIGWVVSAGFDSNKDVGALFCTKGGGAHFIFLSLKFRVFSPTHFSAYDKHTEGSTISFAAATVEMPANFWAKQCFACVCCGRVFAQCMPQSELNMLMTGGFTVCTMWKHRKRERERAFEIRCMTRANKIKLHSFTSFKSLVSGTGKFQEIASSPSPALHFQLAFSHLTQQFKFCRCFHILSLSVCPFRTNISWFQGICS